MELTTRIATHEIQRDALVVLFDNLNDKIADLTPAWVARDTADYARLGRPAPGFTYEPVADINFYPGHVPSLINAPVERYPNVSTIAYQADPKRSSDDWGENYTVLLNIEIMCKSLKSEEEVNSRIQNLLEAAHLVMMDSMNNQTLENTIPKLLMPRQTIGDVFVRRHEKSRGDIWFWQGGALTYPVDKFVSL